MSHRRTFLKSMIDVSLQGAPLVATAAFVAALNACAAAPPAQPPPDPLTFPYDSTLFNVLSTDPGPLQLAAFERVESAAGEFLTDTLAVIAADSIVHPLLRANALHLIGQRQEVKWLILMGPALHEADVRIRLAAVASLREFIAVRPDAATRLLAIALEDTIAAVQAQALEGLAARDAALLRDYLDGAPPPQLAAVARDLLQVAEERGAQLVPRDSTGRLERAGPAGHALLYMPAREWPGWDLSAGPLTLQRADGTAVELGIVEVARNVLPAFFSPDGRFIVLESERTIRVHEIATGESREVGSGIAPRALPFTEDFVYARETEGGRTESPMGTRIQYDILRAPFAEKVDGVTIEPAVIATVGASANFRVNGGASPLRWAFVTETAPGIFTMVTDNADAVALPDPFAPPQAR